MLRLLQAEWLKLSRRPLAWGLLITFQTTVALYIAMVFLALAFTDGVFTGGEMRIQMLPPDQIEQYRLFLGFPGGLGLIFQQFNGTGGIFVIVLTAAFIGSEYSWGTLRLHLMRAPNRPAWLLAKLGALTLGLLVAILITLLVGCLLVLLFGSALHTPMQFSGALLLGIGLAILRVLLVWAPYMLLTAACCIWGRSTVGGMVGGILFLIMDISTGTAAFFTKSGSFLLFLYNLLLQRTILPLVLSNMSDFGLNPSVMLRSLDTSTLPPLWQSILALFLYCGLFYGYAHIMLQRQDVTGQQ